MDFGTGFGEVEIDLAKVGVTGERVDAWPIAVEAEYVFVSFIIRTRHVAAKALLFRLAPCHAACHAVGCRVGEHDAPTSWIVMTSPDSSDVLKAF